MLPWPVAMAAEQHLLALREILVRCDENLKAHDLMQRCVPYFLEDEAYPRIAQARTDQAAMVRHVTDGAEAYAAYYSSNSHEAPFEEQYGVKPMDAHERIPRAGLLRSALLENKRVVPADGANPVLLDCACNDGWMGANLAGIVDYHGLDLNPDCIDRARGRHIRRAKFAVGDLHQAAELTADIRPEAGYDVVVCFECIEHVPDPDATLEVLASLVRPGGQLFVSTPAGAVEQGNLPTWWHVEPKGHVRVYTPRTFTALLEPHGTVDGVALGPDQVLVARLTVPG